MLNKQNSATVTITTTASPLAGLDLGTRPLRDSAQKGAVPIPAFGVAILFPFSVGLCVIGMRKKRASSTLLIAIFLLADLVACGGPGLESIAAASTPPGSYVITVTGTAGGVSQGTQLGLIVK